MPCLVSCVSRLSLKMQATRVCSGTISKGPVNCVLFGWQYFFYVSASVIDFQGFFCVLVDP